MIELEIVTFTRTRNLFDPSLTIEGEKLLALFEGGLIRDNETGEIYTGEPVVGVIAGFSSENKAIIDIGIGFIGWLPISSFRVLNIVETNQKYLH